MRAAMSVTKLARFVAALTLAGCAGGALAAEATTDARPPASRPRIGLVLGGGGAKGAAHIGVIKVLEEMRIPVDCIAGTSMGSIVGAAYATGRDASELQKVITAVDWKDILASAPRQDVPLHRKELDFVFVNGLELGIKDGRVTAPGGLVPTHQIETLFRRIVGGAGQTTDFDRLPIPFRAVATDLESGQMVVFDKGELAIAMRASMAVPGAFAPVEYQGRLLVDGMLVRNLPVDVARQTCADVVIAVPVGNPKVTRDKLRTFLGVAGQAMNIAIEANENAQLATLTDKDVLVKVTLDDIGSSDFAKVPEAIPIGEAAARAVAGQLSRYSLSAQDYAAWRSHLGTVAALPNVKIDEVRLRGFVTTNPEVAKAQLHTQPGDTYDPRKADADANRLVARGDYSAVAYGVDTSDDRTVVTYDAVEKPWGPDYLMFDLNLSTDFKGDTGWGIRVDYQKRWLNALGGEFRGSAQIGRPNVLAAEFYQPLDLHQRWFVVPAVNATQTLEYTYVGDQAVGQYSIRRRGVRLDGGRAFDPWGEVRFGIVRGSADWDSKVSTPGIPDSGKETVAGFTGRFVYDSVDKALFPTQGTLAKVKAFVSSAGLGADSNYKTLSFDAYTTLTRERYVWQLALRGGSDLGSDAPFYDQFRLGGLFNFSGFRRGELTGREYGLASVLLRHRATFLNETLGTAVYSGASLELGNVYKRLDNTPAQGVLTNGSLYLAVDSKIGPVYLAWGLSEGGRSTVYFYIGSSLEAYRQ
jgi:NTE family protein